MTQKKPRKAKNETNGELTGLTMTPILEAVSPDAGKTDTQEKTDLNAAIDCDVVERLDESVVLPAETQTFIPPPCHMQTTTTH